MNEGFFEMFVLIDALNFKRIHKIMRFDDLYTDRPIHRNLSTWKEEENHLFLFSYYTYIPAMKKIINIFLTPDLYI